MKKSEKLDFLKNNHFDLFSATRREVFDELSNRQTAFCCCGRVAMVSHERHCAKFNGKVDAETIKRLSHLLPKGRRRLTVNSIKRMNRKQIKELLPILQAFAEGKVIEYRFDGQPWTETNNLSFYEGMKYRIKPEIEVKYRPFENQDECRKEMHNHTDFGFVKCKKDKTVYAITALSEHYLVTSQGSFSLSAALEVLEFLDGKPFGMKEE